MKKILLVISFVMLVTMPPSIASDNNTLDPAELTVQEIYQVSGNWSSLKRGWNTLILKISDSQNQSISQAKVTVKYDMATMPMNPPDNPVVEKEGGVYEKSIFLGMRGDWKFDISIARDQSDTLGKTTNIHK